MKRALVTGGAGFIGSHLVERLLSQGTDVCVIDDLSTGAARNLDAVRRSPLLHLYLDDMCNGPLLTELVDRVDVVFHLAAAVGVQLIVEDPVRTIETNIRGTEMLLERCGRKGRKVVLASTSEVYGKGGERRFSEEDDLVFGPTTRQRWSYGCSKAIDEFLALAYAKNRRLPVVIVRFFNIVGPRQVGRYGMVVPRFVRQALSGGPITVYGDGRQVRCFTHVSDALDAVCALAVHPEAEGRIFNVGNDEAVTINELAERVRALIDPNARIVHVPYGEAYAQGFEDIRFRVPDIARLKECTGFAPRHDLDAILRDVRDFVVNEADHPEAEHAPGPPGPVPG
ncbi:MAG: NAD-dependent epimerase/dehydratase family protein [Candidatus Brocadiaceae bacterium]|nr:NAD-dependent epimerase/dehydratase family protein [Candidatus Brocadiaceae bacterium]